jgi:hypothetical protein
MARRSSMPRQQMFLRAAPPSANEIIVDHPCRACAHDRNNPPRPLFGDFDAHFSCDRIDELRRQAFDGLLLEKIAA